MNKDAHASKRGILIGQIVFFLLSFPLGLLYFLVAVIGLAVGLATAIIGIGLPILFLTLLCIAGLAEVERQLVSRLIYRQTPQPRQHSGQPARGFFRRFGQMLIDPFTWTSLVYMFLKLPMGIFSFTLALVLPILSAALTFLPLVYLLNLFIDGILGASGVPNTSILIPSFIEIHGSFDLVMFARTFLGVPVGILLGFGTRFLFNGMALLFGEIASALLDIGHTNSVQQPPTAPHTQPPIIIEQVIRGQEPPR